MPTILAIDTSSDLASVALLHRDELITHATEGVQTHSQTILPMVQLALKQAGIRLDECDAIAFGAGPGSFTGVRTACGVAQGLAFGAGLPLVPVGTLEAMAQACRSDCGAAEVLTLLDARMEEVYWAQYRYDGGWREVAAPALAKPAAVAPSGVPVACGNGLLAYAPVFDAMSFADRRADIAPHAGAIATLAQERFAAGQTITAREAQPVYLRNKVALTTAERLARAGG